MDKNIPEKFKQAYAAIKAANRILLLAHVHPDGDALSSLGIMMEIAGALGKNYLAYAEGKENIYDYIPHEAEVAPVWPPDLNPEDFDLIIILDCGSMARTGLATAIKDILELPRPERPYIIEFDHHPAVDHYADLEIRQPQFASNTEILYYFLKENHLGFNKNLANCLLAGILSDTGNFLYPATSDDSVRISAEMLNYGAQLPRIVRQTYQNKNLASMKIWGLALKNLKINDKYNLAVSVLRRAEVSEAIAEPAEGISNDIFGDIVGFLSNLGGVRGILLIREEKDGRLKVNLRTSDPDTNLAFLAQVFGGGGHPQASGFVIDGNVSEKEGGWAVVLN